MLIKVVRKKTIFRLFAAVILCLVTIVGNTSEYDPSVDSAIFQLDIPELNSLVIRDVIADSDGALWLGTEAGLYYFDGYHVEKIDERFNGDTKAPTGPIFSLHFVDDRHLAFYESSKPIHLFDTEEKKYTRHPHRISSLLSTAPQEIHTLDDTNKLFLYSNAFWHVGENIYDTRLIASVKKGEKDGFYQIVDGGQSIFLFSSSEIKVFDKVSLKLVSSIPLPEFGPEDFKVSRSSLVFFNKELHLFRGIKHFVLRANKWNLVNKIDTCLSYRNSKPHWLSSDIEHMYFVSNCGIFKYQIRSRNLSLLIENKSQQEKWLQYAEVNKLKDIHSVAVTAGSYTHILKDGEVDKYYPSIVKAAYSIDVIDGTTWLRKDIPGVFLKLNNQSKFKGLNKYTLELILGTSLLRKARFENEKLWIATQNKGLFLLSPKNGSWQLELNHLSQMQVRDFLIDGDFIWIGTEDNGLYRYNRQITRLEKVPHYNTVLDIYSITEIDSTRILVTTNYGVTYVDKQSPKFKRFDQQYERNINAVNLDAGRAVFKKGEQLWVGNHVFGDKVVKLDRHLNVVGTIAENDISSYPFDIALDNLNNMWIALWGEGLAYKNHTDKFKFLNESNGFPSNTVYSIYEANDGNMWASTSNGLARIQPCSLNDMDCTPKVTSYFTIDGLTTNIFDAEAHFQHGDGTLMFGGYGGLVWFNPLQDIKDNLRPPKNSRFNKILVDSLIKSPNGLNTETFTLPHGTQNISLSFTSPSYEVIQKKYYRYRINGKEWINLRTPEISLNLLPPGKYFIEANYSNNQGIWASEPAKISLIITPPWWHSNTAYLVYFILVIFSVWVLIKWRLHQGAIKNLQLEQTISLRTKELQTALLEKETLFESVSHELRTPLTVILGKSEKLLKSSTSKDIKEINTQSNRLFYLVEKLLKFAEIKAMGLRDIPVNVYDDISRNIFSLSTLSDDKNITVVNQVNVPQGLTVNLKEDTLFLIISNLLGNAIKYSPENSKIYIDVLLHNEELVINISDRGCGFKEVEKVTNKFYREDRATLGTGLGLSLVQEIVTMNNGKLSIENNSDVGANVTVTLPIIEVHQELAEEHSSELDSTIITIDEYISSYVLIVEDDDAIAEHLIDILSKNYAVKRAKNGLEAFRIISGKETPAVVISDVMMPVMNGFEFCRKVKQSEDIAHVPIILLTAKADLESKKQGLSQLADDYITKPFSSDLLLMKVQNVLRTQRALKEKLLNNLVTNNETSSEVKTSIDGFLRKIKAQLNAHYHQENYSIHDLAKSLSVSEKTLNRRMKSLFDASFTQALRAYRLERAYVLLQKGTQASEVTYAVGFSSPAYFGKCFKEKFGITPSQVKK